MINLTEELLDQKMNLVENGIFPIMYDVNGNEIEDRDTGYKIPGTIQGEGKLTGVPCLFIRTSGCQLTCAWKGVDGNGSLCDTPYCVRGDTLVTMADGSSKEIQFISKGDIIVGYDHNSGCLVHTTVTNTLVTKGNKKPTVTIKTDNYGDLHCTSDHNIFTTHHTHPINHKYQEAGEIDITKHRYIQLSDNLTSLQYKDIEGSLEFRLGYITGLVEADGYNSTDKNGNRHYGIDLIDKVPIDFLNESLEMNQIKFKEYNYETRKTNTTGKPIFHTRVSDSDGKEKLDQLIALSVSDMSDDFKKGYLSGFFDGDGGKQFASNRSNQVMFYQREKDLLYKIYDILKTFNLDQYFHFSYSKHGDCWSLKSTGGYDTDVNIYQFMYPMIERKQHSFTNKKGKTTKEFFNSIVPDESPIDTVYDITTGTSNFFANGILVHNSSHIPEKNKMSISDITNVIIMNTKNTNIKHVVISGGEPFMQTKKLRTLVASMKALGLHVTIESNGIVFDEETAKMVDLISLSPKLSTSTPWEANLLNTGAEYNEKKAKKHEKMRRNITTIQSWIDRRKDNPELDFQLKFVCTAPSDIDEIKRDFLAHLTGWQNDDIMLMPEGVTPEDLMSRSGWLSEECVKNGYRFCARMHALLFGIKRGV